MPRSGVRAELQDGQMLEVIPEPAPVDISMLNPDPDKYIMKPTSTACGRAHMLISADLINKEDNQHADSIVISTGNNVFGQGGRQIIDGELFSADHAIISRVVCGQDHSLVLSTDGKLFSCGLGSDGQTGLETHKSVESFMRIKGALAHLKVEDIDCKADTCLALTSCGRLFSWGNNEYGQIWDHAELMQINVPHELHLSPDTAIVPPEVGIASKDLLKIGKIVSIACAGSMNAVVDSFGQVFVWGFGNLGLGPKVEFAHRPTLIPPGLFAPACAYSTEHDLVTDVFSGLHHFVAMSKKLGLIWTWGASRSGISCLGLGKGADFKLQGLNRSTEAQTYPRQVYIPGQVTDVACGVDHTFVLAKDPA
ncbi:Soluble guanylate cyclase gcy-31 [Cichlidogyrus casuarinus]|uniref:Soluble guanylate cyclase gcy-31 n=1 Tax=Cichlidogyrus casuarinus TaxID=1844966 RepID=A0ABD2Q151_9PLAT